MTTMSVRVSSDVRPLKALHVGLWVVQGLLGAMFLAVGAMKATQPITVLADTLGWPAAVPVALVRVIGIGALPIPLVLGGLAAFVAWGRVAKAPIAQR